MLEFADGQRKREESDGIWSMKEEVSDIETLRMNELEPVNVDLC